MSKLSLLKNSCGTVQPIGGWIRESVFPLAQKWTIVWMEFELTNNDITVQHVNHLAIAEMWIMCIFLILSLITNQLLNLKS